MKAFPSTWSAIGKHASRADFVRINATSTAAVELLQALEDGVELLHRRRKELRFEPAQFLFVPTGGVALLGVMGPGADSVGRQFPLAAFLEWPVAALPNLAAIPFFGAEAFAAARALLAGMPSQNLDEGLASLAVPGRDAVELANSAAVDAMSKVRVSDLQDVFPAGPTIGNAWYAVKTVLMAAAARRKNAADAPTLDCPLSSALPASAWLSIFDLGGPSEAPPSLVWSSTRLYVSPARWPAAVFEGLKGGGVESNKIWPVSTTQQAAIASARASLRAAPGLADPDSFLMPALSGLRVTT